MSTEGRIRVMVVDDHPVMRNGLRDTLEASGRFEVVGEAQVEDMLKGLGVTYAIIRPTLVFGVGDLLLNNMAWALRRFPVFPVYGSGDYPVQPVYVEDLAAQAVEAASRSESSVADAGPGRTPCPSRPCFACWPPQWASEDCSCTRPRARLSP